MKTSIVLILFLLSFSALAKNACETSDINCLMRTKLNRMNYCYQRVLSHTSQDLNLNVKVKFEIKKNGDPTNFHFYVSEYHKAIRKGMFTKCLQNAIEAIEFPKPRYSRKIFVYKSFNFNIKS